VTILNLTFYGFNKDCLERFAPLICIYSTIEESKLLHDMRKYISPAPTMHESNHNHNHNHNHNLRPPSLPPKTFPSNRYHALSLLGIGTFSSVHKSVPVNSNSDDSMVAVKIDRQDGPDPSGGE